MQGASAWLSVAPKAVSTGGARTSSQLRAAAGDEGGRPDLVSMKRSFESSMDSKLIMEYVTVRRFSIWRAPGKISEKWVMLTHVSCLQVRRRESALVVVYLLLQEQEQERCLRQTYS